MRFFYMIFIKVNRDGGLSEAEILLFEYFMTDMARKGQT